MNENANGLAVFSGNCLMGLCGEDAGFHDMSGNDLRVGDIVMIYTVKEWGEGGVDYFPDGLTAVVSNEWTSYHDGTHKRSEGEIRYFVMGLASVPMDAPGEWRVIRVKKFEDVVHGEHWSAFGFSYGDVPKDVLEMAGAEE